MGLVQFIGALFFPYDKRFFPSPRKGENHDRWLGRIGEQLAARHLKRNGYRVLYQNFRPDHGGEVDIVCRDKTCNTLVFIEVKTRSTAAFGSPASAVNRNKQKLIARGALAWLRLLDNPDLVFRFDIVEVLVEGKQASLNIIRDAFPLPEPYRY